MDLVRSGARKFVGLWRPVASCGVLWRPVAPCGTGVVGPKEILLQSQLLQPKLGDLYAVGLEAGIDWSDCRLQAGAGGIPCLEGCSLTL